MDEPTTTCHYPAASVGSKLKTIYIYTSLLLLHKDNALFSKIRNCAKMSLSPPLLAPHMPDISNVQLSF